MSQTDSFIDEVTEEVRKDRLWLMIRRYGWIGVVAIVAIVGAASWNEYRKAQERQQAEGLGDAIVTAFNQEDLQARLQDFDAIEGGPLAQPVIGLMSGATAVLADNPEKVIAALEPLAADAALDPVYRDLAALKLVLLGEDVPRQLREDLITQITQPGRPYRLLGLEQKVLLQVELGETDVAVQSADALLQEAGVTQGLQQRLVQLIFALGEPPENL
ncbi:hypothetical protein [Actibacterium sp. 188UL27-1]|uniref:hypothetical protein n=1 Tax=Actibacterium sp. 188UL27-1 TaxID=2786961 RepID=UPI00195E0422|nr:hypothetical protein [Actibacterium sp. 188UL27-1]MBM7066681.1 hypothetical protein [Actibacterium sp. 188UL27-1]